MKKWNPEPGRISFNPRTPCGVRPSWAFFCCHCGMFQSTHSLRSATDYLRASVPEITVSIHALLAECDSLLNHPGFPVPCFNPRTPCGVRLHFFQAGGMFGLFQSTHSLRSATRVPIPFHQGVYVSIHALLAECDLLSRSIAFMRSVSIHALLAECDHCPACRGHDDAGFNPRTPCGVRHKDCYRMTISVRFQSTHSLRSATPGYPSP